MTFSRSHTGMIGIISLFTGMIAPVLGTESTGYPFPLTDLQTASYVILFLLALSFYLVSIQNWKSFRIIASVEIIIIVYMATISLTGSAHTGGDIVLEYFYWGWVFIVIGCIALLYTILSRQVQLESRASIFSDAIIGIVGTLTLIGLSALIIAASINIQGNQKNVSILSEVLGSGSVTTLSGLSMSQAYPQISALTFERKKDRISFLVPSKTGAIAYPEGIFYTGSAVETYTIGDKKIVLSNEDRWIDDTLIDARASVRYEGGALIVGEQDSTTIYTENGKKTYKNTAVQKDTLTRAEGTDTLAWVSKTLSGYQIQKEGISVGEKYPEIKDLRISRSGYDTLAIARTLSGDQIVIKNGIPIENIRKGYAEGSWKSNGSHSIYTTNDAGVKRVIYDGVSIGKEFSDVREVFLDKNGNSYAFFARPIDEDTYCVFTRFKGNICGFTGYMNPRIGADGSSLIYGGLKDGIWGIYRNTDILVQDTGYTSSDNSGDYLFFDITNPKQYLFIIRQSDGTYMLRKNSKVIPGVWEDVGLDVTFGYNNTIIMTAQDNEGWRIIEL